MITRLLVRSVLFRRHYVMLSLLLVLLALPLARIVPAQLLGARVQPNVLTYVTKHPYATVPLIVQKLVNDQRVEQRVAELGGAVTQDLYIINAFAARLPSKAVPELAQTDGVRWISLDAPMTETGTPQVASTNLKSAYVQAVNADKVWNQTPANYQGQGIGVAVVDSGINPHRDLYTNMGVNRLVAAVSFNDGWNQSVYDAFGHGSHVAGIIGGDGDASQGKYIGIAPMVNLINVKVSDDTAQGEATASSVVAGLQWINDNRTKYNIRVVNISLNEGVDSSYQTSAIDAACEILWFNGVVVVVSAGNKGQQGALYPPANDPFVITVGATDDKGTATITDDVMANFSAYGKTSDGVDKPDLVAPGKNIVSLRGNANSGLSNAHPANNVDEDYFRMSGTSMSAPMVAGAAALILQANPNLTPDQVKYRLRATARPFDSASKAGAGYLDVYAAVTGTSTQSANTNIVASRLLWTGSQPVNWNSVNWNSVNWNSVNWNSVNWNSVNWNSVNWNSDYWGN